jgi:phage terminase, large subunit, PBSX family
VSLKGVIGPAFYETHRLIRAGKIDEAVEKGGRASLKSSYVSVEVVLQLLRHPDCHALVTRQVADTMRDSVYAQILWAIDKLGLGEKFRCTQSPLQCVYLPTGQRILFRGLDDPQKIKSIKLPFGYIGIVWFEEADQIKGGEEAVRNVQQSALRGGEYGLTFISFNPPAASRNWANRYARAERRGKFVHHSSYLQAPAEWLGPKFLAQAEYIKETQPTKYRHEYLGEAVGNGTQVFENLVLEPIDGKTIRSFDRPLNGVDWGWYPDAWAYNRVQYDAARRTLYIYDELTRWRTANRDTAHLLLARGVGTETGGPLTADSAEPKSCGDYRAEGLPCREAVKGPGSVNQSMKWLQSLAAICIDPKRCPDTAREFGEYEYEVGKDGQVLPGYPDADNHHIDAVRYATNRLWTRRGT